MSVNELLSRYESAVTSGNSVLEMDNPVLREYNAEFRDALENRAVLRLLRSQVGIPICCGDGHCIAEPTVRCMNGEHETCPEHVESCYLSLDCDAR